MQEDDPRRPLLGNRPPSSEVPSKLKQAAVKLCSVNSWKKRVPITTWLPKYNTECFIRDFIAGTTVALTSIPQGIAYAMIAGVPPQVGLYSSIFPGVVYAMFGSCKVVTIGPTAILAALLRKYVAYSVDFAYLAALLSGCVILLLGVLHLGFLLDFVSKPVISGFTTAAALQIGSAQLRALFRISGSSGNTFISAIINFFKHIKEVQLWDTLLGVVSILALIAVKAIPSPRMGVFSKFLVHAVRARNAVVVLLAAVLVYVLFVYGITPVALTGTIQGGLPAFGPPPFSTTVNNETYTFERMLEVFGGEGLVLPLVSVLESIAIAKAFAGSTPVDATQEMIALGMCNILASFAQCMPATGSFTRTALNHASGVATQAGSIFKAVVVLLAVTLLTRAFYFIPRATLAGVIIVAMGSLVDPAIVPLLWRNSKTEFLVWAITVTIGVTVGLEYGILCGAGSDAIRALAVSARPPLHVNSFKVGNISCTTVTLSGNLSYASASRVSRGVRAPGGGGADDVTVIDGARLDTVDCGVAESLIFTIIEQETNHKRRFLFWNFPEHCQRLFEDLHPGFKERFVSGPSIDTHVLGLNLTHIEDIPVYVQ